MKKQHQKPSGVAIFMYGVILLCALTAVFCFSLYYGGFNKSSSLLWVGIVAFMIVYHLWLRLIMGNVTKLFTIQYSMGWFKEQSFEKGLYKLLRVRKWKDKALTYNPALFSLKNYSLEDVANTMCKAETDHWINELISLSSLLFALLWGEFPIFFVTALCAMLFDAQFIVIQRFNRPRILRIMEKQKHILHQGVIFK